MPHYFHLLRPCLVIMGITLGTLHGWSGTETKGDHAIFHGTLMSHENPKKVLNVTNIGIGKNRESTQVVKLYEMPQKPADTSKLKIIIPVNPYKELTTTDLDLMKIASIEVPETKPWIWNRPADDKRSAPVIAYEFREIVVTWKDSSKMHYLIELGTENTTTPLKVFCDIINEQAANAQKQDEAEFCTGIKKIDLKKNGAPFPAIKKLSVDGYCYEKPQDASAITKKEK